MKDLAWLKLALLPTIISRKVHEGQAGQVHTST